MHKFLHVNKTTTSADIPPPKIRKFIFRLGKYISIFMLTIFAILSIIPYFFAKQINEKVKEIANQYIHAELSYADVSLSFWHQFPSLTTSFTQVELTGSAPFENSKLIQAERISFGINLASLFSERIIIDQFFMDRASIHVLVDSTGLNNYNLFQSEGPSSESDTDSLNSNIAIKEIKIKSSDIFYQDESIPFAMKIKNLNYKGIGDLSKAIFDLKTTASIESFSLNYQGEDYIQDKELHAELITKVNTHKLSFIFERNDIKINKLPLRFKGKFAFLSNGYALDFKLKSDKSSLEELLSTLPPAYNQWLKDTKIKGKGEVYFSLEGNYIAELKELPNLAFSLGIQDGYIAYKQSKAPLEALNLNFNLQLPACHMDSLSIDLKTFNFKIASGYFDAHMQSTGIDPLVIQSHVKADFNLETFHQALGISQLDFKGLLKIDGSMQGTYATAIQSVGIRGRQDTIIQSIPLFSLQSSLSQGYLKFKQLPQAIDQIAFQMQAEALDNQLKHATFNLRNIDIRAMNNSISGYMQLKNFLNMEVDTKLQADINLADIHKVYPLDQFDMRGNLFVHMQAAGYFDYAKKIFPVSQTTVSLKNGYLKPADYEIPLEEINVETYISSAKGRFQDLKVQILPISFKLTGEPFFLYADFVNFNNIKYAMKSAGRINLAPLYRIFAIPGMQVDGYIKTNFDLAGLQSDAENGRYQRLKNKGHLEIGNLQIRMEDYPLAFQIQQGKMNFFQEKIMLQSLKASYGKNKFSVAGSFDNIISYLSNPYAELQGQMHISAPKIAINDFMVFASPSSNTSAAASAASSSAAGVILLPKQVNFKLTTDVQQMTFNDMLIQNFRGQLQVHQGKLTIDSTQFNIAGAQVRMQSNYSAINLKRAKFNYAIQADSFDIQRAYREVPLFREMASSARYASGQVSLNYELSGLLDQHMSPLYSSLEGQGVLQLENIKFKNFKLLNDMAKQTDKSHLSDAQVKQVRIQSALKNKVMTISRTKMKVAFLRPRFEGQVHLDGRLNLGFRLGLPPFGIFGIPMHITGTAENPIIKFQKYKAEDLDEELDEEDAAAYQAQKEKEALEQHKALEQNKALEQKQAKN